MNFERYRENKTLAIFNNDEPSLTDQSQAKDTDINVIVGRFGIGHLATGNKTPPVYADFTDLPRDLRGFIERARSVDQLYSQLPQALQQHSVEEILNFTPEQLHGILHPAPAPTPAPETPKES